VGLLTKDLPEWDPQTLGKIDYYYWFYASYALNQYDGPSGPCWNSWNKKMLKVLVDNQKTAKDGCAAGSWDPIDRWGDEAGRVYAIAEKVRERTNLDYKVTVLGHIQRGGSPTVRDRVLASRLGFSAVTSLKDGISGVMVGEVDSNIELTPLDTIWTNKKKIDTRLCDLVEMLSI